MNAFARHWDIVRAALVDEKARAGSVVRTEETDFLPAALEIIERPVSPTARFTARAMLAGLVVAIAWMVFGRLDVVASAGGQLLPAGNVKLVQPAALGIVHAILVHNGQQVRAGQPLVELDPTVSTADLEQAAKALQTAALDAARDRAILSALDGHGFAFAAPAGASPDAAETARALARARIAQIEAGAATHDAERSAAVAALAEARGQTAKLTETLPLIDQQVAANEQLLAKGYVSKLRVIEMRRQQLGAVRDRGIAIDTAGKARAQIAQASSAAAESREEARASVLDDLGRAEAEARLRGEELVKSRQRASLQRLIAPVDGTVAQLAVHTLGGVVEPAKPIMTIVPSGGTLVMEGKLRNRDVGFVHAGLPVAVKLDAFPFNRFGTVPGHVQTVSSDSIPDQKLGLVYIVRVTLDRPALGKADIALSPGMTAVADIRTGSRSIASYLLSPITEEALQAGRER